MSRVNFINCFAIFRIRRTCFIRLFKLISESVVVTNVSMACSLEKSAFLFGKSFHFFGVDVRGVKDFDLNKNRRKGK